MLAVGLSTDDAEKFVAHPSTGKRGSVLQQPQQ
jgi:hypothetical protein